MAAQAQAALVNVLLDAPAFANGPIYNGDSLSADGLPNLVPDYALQISEVEVYGTAAPALLILTQPQNLITRPGRTATFTVAVGIGRFYRLHCP